MKTKEQIKGMIDLINSEKGYKAWKKIGFTPYSYTDVLKVLEWVMK